MKKSGCHLNYDTRQKLDRTYSLERTSNENRLNHLVKKENEVKPLFQPKAETKAIERDNDNGFRMCIAFCNAVLEKKASKIR